jgi:hypothetical protein
MRKLACVRIEVEVWRAYREFCRREKLSPYVAVEEFLKVAVENGSASNVLNMMRVFAKTRAEGFEAYARVLLGWYQRGKYFFPVSGSERVSVEGLLLNALKDVREPDLRGRIEEALSPQAQLYLEERGSEAEKAEDNEHGVDIENLEDEGPEDLRARDAGVSEIQRKIAELKRLRELAKRAKGS